MQYYTNDTALPAYIPYPRFLLALDLNDTARLVYSLLLSRAHLSQANGWVDELGRVFIRYTIRALVADTGKSKSTIVTALADLESHGLLVRQREGMWNANKLYIRMPDSCTSGVQNAKPQRYRKPAANNKVKNYNENYTGDGL